MNEGEGINGSRLKSSGVVLEVPAMTINVSAERNSKGWNISASVLNAPSVDQAMSTLKTATEALERTYGRIA